MGWMVTGFVPFGGFGENTAAWAAAAADARALLLPVEYDRAADLLLEEIARRRPALVLSIGMAGKRASVDVEALAHNVDDAELADNAGTVRRGSPIVPGGPATLTPRFPREEMCSALRAMGWPAGPSADAGRFVCNNLFYRVAHALAADAEAPAFTFLHIPGPMTWGRDVAERFGRDLARALG